MQLKNKTAVVYGGGGVIGGAVAAAFSRAGAHVYLAGPSKDTLEKTAKKIEGEGGHVDFHLVDALDPKQVEDHLNLIVGKHEHIDITFNAIGVNHLQGIPLTDMSLRDFNHPISTYVTTNFITATAAARHMIKNKSGVILTISTPGSQLASALAGGFGVSNAALEGLTRQLAGELGPHGIRAICMRSDAIPETVIAGSHAREVFSFRANLIGKTVEELFPLMAEGTLLKRSVTLENIGNTAVFLASNHAQAITATTINLTCGSFVG